MSAERKKGFWRDESGAVMIEVTVTIFTFLVILFGVVEFSYAFYQWNIATKATQLGARLAAVSEPVASSLTSLTGLSNTVLPGDPMPGFDCICSGATNNCISGSAYTCPGAPYSISGTAAALSALNTIVYGRGNNGTSCGNDTSNMGMCNVFYGITRANVVVRYQYTGLGYAGRPPGLNHTGAPVPTITVSLTGLKFNFVLLGGLLGFKSIDIPGLATTITGEDLNVSGS